VVWRCQADDPVIGANYENQTTKLDAKITNYLPASLHGTN